MVPELHNTLVNDGRQYYLVGEEMYWELPKDNASKPFTVVKCSPQKKRIIPCPHLTSSQVVNRINAAIRMLSVS